MVYCRSCTKTTPGIRDAYGYLSCGICGSIFSVFNDDSTEATFVKNAAGQPIGRKSSQENPGSMEADPKGAPIEEHPSMFDKFTAQPSILREIFWRLPDLECLLRCTKVCKLWNREISNLG